MNKTISIIIPNFNGEQLLLKNLPSVINAAAGLPSINIIVVDDGSSDNSLKVLTEYFPGIQVVIHEKNRGFSDAIYSGVLASNAELLFLLNSDVELKSNGEIFNVLAEYFNQEEVFSVSPLIVNDQGHITRHSWNRKILKYGRFKSVEWSIDQALSLRKSRKLTALYASGGSMMVRKSMFIALQGFHPLYKPFYSEDFDIGLRAWRKGWRSYFEPTVSVIHQSKGSIKNNIRRAYVKQVRRRNNYILEWLHLPLPRLFFTVIPLTLWQLLGEILLFDKINIRGFITALPKIQQIILARKEIKSQQKLTFAEILKETTET